MHVYPILGETFKSLATNFHLGPTTIGKIVAETAKAIHEKLAPLYLKVCMPNVQYAFF